MSGIAYPTEAEAFLAAHPEITAFDILFTSMSGVPRGKRLRRHEIMKVFTEGRFLPTSLLAVDTRGEDCYETGLVWEDGDSDRVAKPISGRLNPAPWLGSDMGQVLLSLYDLDGTPNIYDPRHVLKRVLDRFAEDGQSPVVAVELEFYLIHKARGPKGEIIPLGDPGIEVYGLPQIEVVADFLRDLWAAADVAGIPLEGAISENAPGQFELTLKHKADALSACDDAILYKSLTKAIALKHGYEAVFMAKPFNDQAGSGCHIHISLNDYKGHNLCAAEAAEGSENLRHMIGGMKAKMSESMAFFAPNANAFKRFRAHSYAPQAATWGVNNRTTALRIAAGTPESRHVEHRVAGADANPYLAVASILAGAHWGLKHGFDPGPAVTGNAYDLTVSKDVKLPSNWARALRELRESDMLHDYLGSEFIDIYIKMKTVEMHRFFDVVTPHDHDWYLKNA